MTNKSSLLQSKRTKCANLLLLLCCIYLWHNTYQCAALLWMSPLVCLDRFVKIRSPYDMDQYVSGGYRCFI